ncbi:MOSC domain-containing protein [Evansella sp. AB-rgal1]|uniref:MOSC domain-containing protein n=1 Tax=Evansella sp. AB-rgal1 TaxID=3242696 RepID=UPI00359E90D7
MDGQVKSIWIKRMKRGPMDATNKVTLVENKGIATNADQGGKRQVTIIQEEIWTELMRSLDADLDPATRRANLMIKGIDLKNSRGKILQIGDCEIEICGETKPCERMDEALPGLKDAMFSDWRGGAFGKVLTNGEIHTGDSVKFK